jgi:hypothetical protein
MKAAYSLVLGLTIAITGGSCSAQSMNMQSANIPIAKLDLPPAKDQATAQSFHNVSSGAYFSPPSAGSSIAVSRPYPTSPRTADTKFFLLNGIHLGMAVFDVEMTQRCIANHRCHETNPLMPSSQAGQLGINFALVGSGSLASYWLKKHQSRLWWLPPATGAAAHSYGVATGFEHQ